MTSKNMRNMKLVKRYFFEKFKEKKLLEIFSKIDSVFHFSVKMTLLFIS